MKISDKKKERISEHIISVLYNIFPKPLFTSEIAEEIARDEEFVKFLLTKLAVKGIVSQVKKNPKGYNYLKRMRWRLSNKAHEAYSKHS